MDDRRVCEFMMFSCKRPIICGNPCEGYSFPKTKVGRQTNEFLVPANLHLHFW
jgi:hypothetical protein